ncbi:MAG: DnaJ domain-containing protein [Firmicutes bacterium]|nr:DnaJ domain-containing protein [Bacillota bacterium]
MFSFDYYKTLGLKYPSSQEEIKKAYHKLAKSEHPDKGGSEEKMKRINLAYTVLSNETTKAQYDDWYIKTVLDDIHSSHSNTSYEPVYERKEKTLVNMHLITIEQNVIQQTVDPTALPFDYKKYLSDNELYAYEKREGSHISTVITYKYEWYTILSQIYPTNKTYTYGTSINDNQNNKKRPGCGFFSVMFLVALVVVSVASHYYNHPSTSTTYTTPAPAATRTPTPATPTPYVPPEQPLPDNGYVFKYPAHECVAPLTIETNEDSYLNYYIYLQYCGESQDYDISFFVRAGCTVDIDVPIGTYKLYYCTGYTWYGTDYKFGSGTAYSTSDDLLEFYYDDYSVWGHTITLYPVTGGNFDTEYINENEFPD